MTVNRFKFIDALSLALDYLEIGSGRTVTNHNRRVALIAVNLGKALGLPSDDISDLFVYAMLHDNGLASGDDYIDGTFSHCERGEQNIQLLPIIKKRANILKYHHEAWNGSGFYGITGNNIPLFSQIIAAADYAEREYRGTGDKRFVLKTIHDASGILFSPEITDAFAAAGSKEAFWFGLDDICVDQELYRTVPETGIEMNTSELAEVAGVVARIIDAKSPFTGRHSQGIAQKIAVMADYYGYDEEKKKKLSIAANLHDVGKLIIPNSILDKQSSLTIEEFDIMKRHVYYTTMMLSAAEGFSDIAAWAGDHHEKLNGKGYPYGKTEQDLPFESQLMACVDIYQALTEDRPYRKALVYSEAIRILQSIADSGGINKKITRDIQQLH